MPRSLNFTVDGNNFNCELEKIDRNKLYGWVDRIAYDRDGKECYLGAISSDGMHMFGRSSFEQGYLDGRGTWLNASELKLVDADDQELSKVESSFIQEIDLTETVPIDTYLNYVIKSVYLLHADPALLARVKSNEELYSFPFNYYASHSPDAAFLLESDGALFMAIGQHCGFQYLEMQNIEEVVLEEDDEEEDGDGEIDFSMF